MVTNLWTYSVKCEHYMGPTKTISWLNNEVSE